MVLKLRLIAGNTNVLWVFRQPPRTPPPATGPGKQENKVQVCKVVFGTSRSCLLACRRCRKLRSDPTCDRLREAPAKNSAAAKNKSPNSNRHAVESDCGHFLRAAEVSQRAATSFHSVPLATDGWSSGVGALPRIHVQDRWSGWVYMMVGPRTKSANLNGIHCKVWNVSHWTGRRNVSEWGSAKDWAEAESQHLKYFKIVNNIIILDAPVYCVVNFQYSARHTQSWVTWLRFFF